MSAEQGKQAEPIARATFKADTQPLIDKLTALLEDTKDISLIKYPDESENPKSSKMIQDGIVRDRRFLNILAEFQPNLSFGKIVVGQILAKVATQAQIKFKSAQERKEWTETMRRRWQNCTRHTAAYKRKKDQPQWFHDLFGAEAADREVEEAADREVDEDADREVEERDLSPDLADVLIERARAAKPVEREHAGCGSGEITEGDYELKFSTELMLPMRKNKNSKKAIWEAGLVDSICRSDDQGLACIWPDGYEAELEQTHGWLKGLQRTSGSKETMPSLWSGIHKITKHRITLKQRTDRELLISVFEQNAQILQVRADKFGSVPIVDGLQKRLNEDSETLRKAIKFMTPILEAFIEDKIQKGDLKAEKDQIMCIGCWSSVCPPCPIPCSIPFCI
jgi:hypothetical protein